MKKTGFTLAEVLITLAIIGVVATMTLPALMTNTQEQQAKTGLKKMINTLTLAAETNSALYGYDYSSITNESVNNEDPQKQTLYALFALNTNMDRDTNLTAKAPESKLRMLGGATDAGGDNYVVFFKDGSALSYDHNTLSTGNNAILQDDGIPYGIPILIDQTV